MPPLTDRSAITEKLQFERGNASILNCFHLNVSTTFHRVDFHLSMTLENNSSDAEPGYVHSVAPDPRRLDPLDNPVRATST